MRGKILGFDTHSGDGVISGDDGQRYSFQRGGLQGGTDLVLAGQDVDFEGDNHTAASIFVIRSSASSEKNKYVAALLAFFLGLFGAHKFYLGHTGLGITYLLLGTIGWLLVLPGIILSIICLIEAVLFLVKPEDEFYRQYVVGRRAMF